MHVPFYGPEQAEPQQLLTTGAASSVEVPLISERDAAKIRKRLREKERRRILPGFYEGARPRDE